MDIAGFSMHMMLDERLEHMNNPRTIFDTETEDLEQLLNCKLSSIKMHCILSDVPCRNAEIVKAN